MKNYNQYMHGLPGIGITGNPGIEGKQGNSFYIGHLNDFFVNINEELQTYNKDYDDIDYNLSYTLDKDEKRLSLKYHAGDILLITSINFDETELKPPFYIRYMVEITDDLTVCTREYFLKYLTYAKPFTKKFGKNEDEIVYPLNIVNNTNNPDIILNNIFRANEKHANSLVSITGVLDEEPVDDPSIDDPSIADASIDDPSIDDPSIADASIDDPSIADASIDDPSIDDDYSFGSSYMSAAYRYGSSVDDGSIDDPSIDDDSSMGDPNKIRHKRYSKRIPSIKYKYSDIPSRVYTYNKISDDDEIIEKESLRQKIINNGKEINVYDYPESYILQDDTDKHILLIKASVIKDDSEYVKLSINGVYNKGIKINAEKTTDEVVEDVPIFIDNLYIRNSNYGNVESYGAVYDKNILLDKDGFCYTLTRYDYDINTQLLNINPNMFVKDKVYDSSKYTFGYIHMYWNYNENSSYIDTLKTDHYKPNYITGYSAEPIKTPVVNIVTDSDGNFVRSWDDPSFVSLTNSYIKEVLINISDREILWDNSTMINKSVDTADIINCSLYKGIIKTEETLKNAEYSFILTIEPYLEVKEDGSSDSYCIQYRKYKDEGKEDKLYKMVLVQDEDSETEIYETQYEELNIEDLPKYIDTSFYSGIEYISNPSILSIDLTSLKDKNAYQYRHHNIIQWITAPNGLKYFSKVTEANYNALYNTYNIYTTWEYSKNIKQGVNDVSIFGLVDIFNLTFSNKNCTIEINEELNNDYINIKDILLYENQLICESVPSTDYSKTFSIEAEDETNLANFLYDSSIFAAMYKDLFMYIEPQYATYTIKYNINNEDSEEKYHLVTFNRMIKGYKELRKPITVTLRGYNEMEDLELLNSVKRGILCNQFQTFVDINIHNFTEDIWGQLKQYYPDMKIRITLTNKSNADYITDEQYNIYYSIVRPNVDIFKATSKELSEPFYILDAVPQPIGNGSEISFDVKLDNIKEGGVYRLRIFIESENPVPAKIIHETKVSSIKFIFTNEEGKDEVYEPTQEYYTSLQSSVTKIILAPVSLIAAYNQNYENNKISNIGAYKWFGSSDLIHIGMKPYMLQEAEKKSWKEYKFKRRYLQDNVTNINIDAVNINNIYTLIPSQYYNFEHIALDNDDVYNSYLQCIFNSKLLNPYLGEDLYLFEYNRESYLASAYGLIENNTAVFVEQNMNYEVRSAGLINAMKIWNNEYDSLYKYESDNPFKGHYETYGNGYLYLPNSADGKQYEEDDIYSLESVRIVNEDPFFDTDTTFEYIHDINRSYKGNTYIPNIFFSTLLYQIKWAYPQYFVEERKVMLNSLPLSNAYTYETTEDRKDISEMPYNMCYNISPKMMFNDEFLYHMVLMLRKPCVLKEGLYALTANNLAIPGVNEEMEDVTNPLNVLY